MNIRCASLADLKEITDLETQCFPETEAATRESLEKRLMVFPNHFWILEEEGKIVSAINGFTTNTPLLRDEMYANAELHSEEGAWQMIFGIATLPEYRRKGYATKLLEQVINDCKAQERKGIVLTCKNEWIKFYEQFGFINEGKSMSKHGGIKWNEMRLSFIEF